VTMAGGPHEAGTTAAALSAAASPGHPGVD